MTLAWGNHSSSIQQSMSERVRACAVVLEVRGLSPGMSCHKATSGDEFYLLLCKLLLWWTPKVWNRGVVSIAAGSHVRPLCYQVDARCRRKLPAAGAAGVDGTLANAPRADAACPTWATMYRLYQTYPPSRTCQEHRVQTNLRMECIPIR